MRSLTVLALLSGSAAIAAPLKEDLPPGAIGRLGPTVPPAKDGKRPGDVNVLLFVNDQTLFVGTNAGWSTWDVQKRRALQSKPVGASTFAAAGSSDRLWVGSVKKLHAIEPPQSATAEPAQSWETASEAVRVLAVSPNGKRIVYSDGDLKLALLDASTGKRSGTVVLASRPVAAVLACRGRLLGVVTRDGAARCYQLASDGTIDLLWTKRIARSDRVPACFSPDGRLFATSSAGRVVILETVTGRQVFGFERKFGEGDVRALAFSPSGRQIVVGSNGPGAVVRVWSIDSGREQATFTGHLGDVSTVAIAPEGASLASGGDDQGVLLWKMPPPAPPEKTIPAKDAWESLDALGGPGSQRAMTSLLADRTKTIALLRAGFRGVAGEQKKVKRWVAELDHDEFRVREAARKALLKEGIRAAAALADPKRKPMGLEGEQRVKSILDELESKGLRVPESGLYGEPLRGVRGIRVLEIIGGKDALALVEEFAKGPPDSRLAREAKAALETWPAAK